MSDILPAHHYADRDLHVYADGLEVGRSCRIRLFLLENLSLLPHLYSLKIWDLSESAEACLCAAAALEVRSGSSILASGAVISACPRMESGQRVLSVSFSPGMALWQSAVSLSLNAGIRVSDTIRAILAASGTDVPLAAFLAEDRRISRPQAFFGRTCDALRTLADSVHAKVFPGASGLCVVDPSLQAPTLFFPEESMRGDVLFLPDRFSLSTEIAGWPLGACVQFTWRKSTYRGLLSAHMLNLDNRDGSWLSQLEIMTIPVSQPGVISHG